jgi:glycosyltransferase involved in cell wall biosynthesis
MECAAPRAASCSCGPMEFARCSACCPRLGPAPCAPTGGPGSRVAATGRGTRRRRRCAPLAIDRAPPWGLQAMARRYRPSTYLNLGHSNHSARVLRPMRQCGARVVVLIHDLIPLTHPDIVPPKQPARFARRIAQVRAHASLVVAVSGDTENALRAHWPDGPAPPIVRAEIGVEVPDPPVAAKSARGRFLMVGTLEPRKNHAVVLDAWEGAGRRHWGGADPEAAHIGSAGLVRGGDRRENPRPSGIRHDGVPRHRRVGRTLRAAYSEADTLLYPSLAEGFGLPPHEALDHGLLPICADLPSLRARVWATMPFTLTQGTSILGRKR